MTKKCFDLFVVLLCCTATFNYVCANNLQNPNNRFDRLLNTALAIACNFKIGESYLNLPYATYNKIKPYKYINFMLWRLKGHKSDFIKRTFVF